MNQDIKRREVYSFAGVITVEMTVIVPVILGILFLSILGIFYYHDKEVISACAYETAVIGSTKMREKNKITSDQVAAIFDERIRGKTILFGRITGSASVDESEIIVKAEANRRRMRLSVSKSASVTEPEKKIRRYRRLGLRK